MLDLQEFSDKFQRSLTGVLKEPSVSADEGYPGKFLVYVLSPTFEGLDEGERQEIVWEQVFKCLDEDEQERIEFIFTEAPSEVAS